VDFVATVRKTNPALEFSAAYALAAIPARYALERNAWSEAATLPVPELPHWSSFPSFEALIEYSHALGRAHTGDVEGARKAIDRMQQLRSEEHTSELQSRFDLVCRLLLEKKKNKKKKHHSYINHNEYRVQYIVNSQTI